MKKTFWVACMLALLTACKSDNEIVPTGSLYFPPLSGNTWETMSMAKLGWNESAVPALKEYLAGKNTKSFMILVNGKIVMEEYFNGHTPSSVWQWNSAGKTLVSAATGIAQAEGLMLIDEKVSRYLGSGWTSEPADKEDLITSRHLLTMTSGINDERELITKAGMTYLVDAGTRWSYHNVFQKLMDVVSAASGESYETFFNTRIRDKIGMDGYWNNGVIFTIYHSTTRSMARFGLLALNGGKWENEQIIDGQFFRESTQSSQDINPAYGYLWWLNGKTRYMIPGGQKVFDGPLVPNAPASMFAAMGAEDQRLYIIPDKDMVIVRMGNSSDPQNSSFAVSGFDNELWQKINAVIE